MREEVLLELIGGLGRRENMNKLKAGYSSTFEFPAVTVDRGVFARFRTNPPHTSMYVDSLRGPWSRISFSPFHHTH